MRISVKWTEDEQKCFEHYLKLYHTDFRLIAELLPNRTYTQVRSHYYNQIKSKELNEGQSIIESNTNNNIVIQLKNILSKFDNKLQVSLKQLRCKIHNTIAELVDLDTKVGKLTYLLEFYQDDSITLKK
ncbi:Conserved_hypothetical protein [Hexamita inflata]|uniref:HTH myb-type domain-containing protein n=1 Tax=Hexamita inflata TaxID=28002 RepID=A0AA86PUG7_9EUKA|nr:Conserved hypothetical protein [Hexamita inflata]